MTSQCCAAYGPGTGDIVYHNLMCSGSEDSLFECPRGDADVEHCSHGDDVGVICQGGKTVISCVRLGW